MLRSLGATSKLRESASRFPDANTSEAGSLLCGSRITVQGTRTSLFLADFSFRACTRDRSAFVSVQSRWLSNQLSVDASRLMAGVVTFAELSFPLRRGSGYSYQDTPRMNALCQMMLMIWYIPVLPMDSRARFLLASAGATGQAFKCLRKGADTR